MRVRRGADRPGRFLWGPGADERRTSLSAVCPPSPAFFALAGPGAGSSGQIPLPESPGPSPRLSLLAVRLFQLSGRTGLLFAPVCQKTSVPHGKVQVARDAEHTRRYGQLGAGRHLTTS